MALVKRYEHNPILLPEKGSLWDAEAAFNPSVIKDGNAFHIVYRAVSSEQHFQGVNMKISSIGYAESADGLHVTQRRQLILPEQEWEKFGCEDPRVVKLDDTFYIFYTAISSFPPGPSGIKIGVALTKDFKRIDEKHLVTPFNAKAMGLFPEKIDGKFYGILTADTDVPPGRIALIRFERIEQLWDEDFWMDWYANLPSHVLPLQRDFRDQVELGAPPLKTDKGWLVIYSYIQDYLSSEKIFGIEAFLLDLEDPTNILCRTTKPIMTPEQYYELYGDVKNIVFPSGAGIEDDVLSIYYGASDTAGCVATLSVSALLTEMETFEDKGLRSFLNTDEPVRFEGNPILTPKHEHIWESDAVFNPAIIDGGGKIHIVYRALGKSNVSVLGYASTIDGLHIDERLENPIYEPHEMFEIAQKPGGSGCEDPRLARVGDKIYMLYTAYDGFTPRVAMTCIREEDFLKKEWKWMKPILISPPGIADKDACMIPEMVNGKYYFFHRIEPAIWIDSFESLEFSQNQWVTGKTLFTVREGKWDDLKIGMGATPIKTDIGWLLIYHGITKRDWKYRLGLAVLDLDDPSKILLRTDEPFFEPLMGYENSGNRPGTVFTCGAAVVDDILFLYYGASDQYVGVARMSFSGLVERLKKRL